MIAPPHGGVAVRRVTARRPLPEGMRRVCLGPVARADLIMIGVGAYAPLTGFMTAAACARVAAEMRLPSGALWPIPIALPLPQALAEAVAPGERLVLVDGVGGDGAALGEMTVAEVFTRDLAAEAEAVYGTADPAHPGVAALLGGGPYAVAGEVVVYDDVAAGDPELPCLEPAAVRAAFAARGWRRVVAFQTRNPVHRAHEYILRCALEQADGLLLHPLVGHTKADDVPAPVRMACYRAMLAAAFPPESVLLAALAAPMRYAGPREAVLHAIVRQNFGCTHLIVGRDHAGVGAYYGPYAAQALLSSLPADDLAIAPLCFDATFYCAACGQAASGKTCPHPADARLALSGTEVRAMLRRGERPPQTFTRPEVADVLIAWARAAAA